MKSFKHFTEAKMSRQHYQMIADVIQSLKNPAWRGEVAEAFADALASTNPQFKKDLFIKAATK